MRSLQIVDGIRNQLREVHTYLCHDDMTLLGGRAPCRIDRGPLPELETPGPCWAPPGLLGVLWARSLQIIDGIRNQLNHMHTYLCRDGTDQLILPQGEIDIVVCRNMPFRGRARQGSRVRFPKEERCVESPPTFICGKRRKNRRELVKMKILSSGVVFTFEEGINTSRVCLKGQQPIF